MSTASANTVLRTDRFRCLPGCGLCCSYRVSLTPADQDRLGNGNAWEITDGEHPILRRPAGFCSFLDSHQRCSIYSQRPAQCRAYPYLLTRYYDAELDVDFSCPGLGAPDGVIQIFEAPAPENERQRQDRETAIQQLLGLLRAQQRYAPPDMLRRLGMVALDTLNTAWQAAAFQGAGSLMLAQPAAWSGNAESETDFARLQSALAFSPIPLADLLGQRDLLERHFNQEHYNTQISEDALAVAIYRFALAADGLRIQDETTTQVPFDGLDTLAWSREALTVRHAYLARWIQRQLPFRLANNLAVARLWQGGHTATCYVEFLLEIDHRLAILTPALARRAGRAIIDRSTAVEALRGSDNLMRAWCESAQITLGA